MIDKIIMYDSPEAATHVTGISGWVSADGRYFGDNEDAARYAGCTHVRCAECHNPTGKGWTLCDVCRDKADVKRYNQRPRVKWDGNVPLYSEELDEWFDDMCAVQDRLDELEERLSIADLRLVMGKPVYATPLEPDYFECNLPDDGYLPEQLLAAVEAFNEAVRGVVLSWDPGKYAMEDEE